LKFFDLIKPHTLLILKGAFWSLSGAFLSKGISVFSFLFVARMLGPKGYGEFGVIQTSIGMFLMFGGLGLGTTLTKYIAEFRDTDKDKTGNIIVFAILISSITSFFICILIFLFSDWFATNLISAPHLSSSLRIGAIYLFIHSLVGLQNGILTGFESFKDIAIQSTIISILTFPLVVGGVFFFGFIGLMWGLVGSSFISFLTNYFLINKLFLNFSIPIKFRNWKHELNVFKQFAFPSFLAGIMVGPVNWICNTILINYPNGYSEIGIYNAANQWMIFILFIPGALASIVLPSLTRFNKEINQSSFSKFLKYNIILNILISAVLASIIYFFSNLIMVSYGSPFADGAKVLKVMAMTGVFIAYNNVIGQAIASKGKMWIGFWLNFMWALFLIVITYVLSLSGQGAFGYAKANLFAYLLLSLTTTLILIFKNEK
jgi:O-antigen/teichoic acid export membrane protein